jgi:hypothetical protein
VRRLLAPILVAVVALGAAACGGEKSAASTATTPETAATGANPVPDYLAQLDSIKVRADDARSDYHNAPLGEPTLEAARDLAEIAGEVADELEGLEPPPSHADLHARMIDTFREPKTAIDAVLARTPVSTDRLGNVIREHWKILDDLHDEMLVTLA